MAKASRRGGARSALAMPVDTAPMEARLVDQLPDEPGWQFEPKWDGFRCLAFRNGNEVDLRAKSGKPLSRFFPEVLAALRALEPKRFVVDGELVVVVDGLPSFDALQMRLHPADSRIRKLSNETPATYILFDYLQTPTGESLLDAPLRERRAALENLYARLKNPALFQLTPYTRKCREAKAWLDDRGGSLDGVVAKRLDGPYASGERAMLKVKRLRTADCVVGGFRYLQDRREVGSLLLGLFNRDGKLDHVGFTSMIRNEERKALTGKLEALAGGTGFTGNAPGGPSRWSTERSAQWTPLKPMLVVEVCYDHVTAGRFRHGTRLLRWRPDKAPSQCTFDQIEPPARAEALIAGAVTAAGARPGAGRRPDRARARRGSGPRRSAETKSPRARRA